MRVKGTEEQYKPKKNSLSPIIKLFLQNNCQEVVFGADIKYSRHYTYNIPEIVFSRERNIRKKFLGESEETRLSCLRALVHFFHDLCFS